MRERDYEDHDKSVRVRESIYVITIYSFNYDHNVNLTLATLLQIIST